MACEQYYLRWQSQLPALRSVMEVLYAQQTFVDVTLACADGFIRAHRLILAASSPYLASMLMLHPCDHPVLILHDIQHKHMSTILAFIYHGYIEVDPDDLDGLVQTATQLEIHGLNEAVTSMMSVKKPCESGDVGSGSSTQNQGKKIKPGRKAKSPGITDISTYVDTLCVDSSEQPVKAMVVDDVNVKPEPGGLLADNQDGTTVCPICFRDCRTSWDLQHHLCCHSGSDKPYRCDLCPMAFTRSSHLIRHRRRHTGEQPYRCPICLRRFSRQDKLKQHIKRHALSPHLVAHSTKAPEVPSLSRGTFTNKGHIKPHHKRSRLSKQTEETLHANTNDYEEEDDIPIVSDHGLVLLEPLVETEELDVVEDSQSPSDALKSLQQLGECTIRPVT